MPHGADVYMTFGSPPPGLAADQFGGSYEQHAASVEGVAAARRFALEAVVGTTSPTMYSQLVLFELAGDGRQALARLEAAVTDRAAAPPGSVDGARFASFYGAALEGPIDLARLDHAYLVFSRPPEQIPLDEYIPWYHTHARENLTADGFDAVWRYRLEPGRVDPLAPCDAIHAAIYEVHGELPELRAALREAAAAGRVSFPEWFGEIQFASLDCRAAAATIARDRG